MIPVFALINTMIPPRVPTLIPCTTGAVMGRGASNTKPRNAEIGSAEIGNAEIAPDELPDFLCGWTGQGI